MLYVCDHCSLSLEQNKMVLMTVDAWWRGVCVERVVIAAVISQGSKHILLHDCYLCKKKNKKQSTAEGLKSKFKQTLCQSPGSLCEWSGSRFCLTDNNLGFPIFEESCSGLFLNNFLRKIMNNQEALEKKTSVSGFSFFFFLLRAQYVTQNKCQDYACKC